MKTGSVPRLQGVDVLGDLANSHDEGTDSPKSDPKILAENQTDLFLRHVGPGLLEFRNIILKCREATI